LLDIPVPPPDTATAPPEPPLARSQAKAVPDLLQSRSATERLSGLMRLPGEGDVGPMAEVVYRLCMDVDAGVRAAAVALLPRLPGTVSARLLKKALDDPEPRVQANAIEALDALGLPDRGALISAKLNSPDNRVRANAVKSCLRAEMYQAAEVLLDMLDSASAAHRISGLWVVERLHLGSVVSKVEQMVHGDADEQVRARARAVCDRLAARPAATTRGRGLQPAR
jgi:HEAT repeat protein